ncbi:MAG: tetratricopeptide repeat protein [bacterium]
MYHIRRLQVHPAMGGAPIIDTAEDFTPINPPENSFSRTVFDLGTGDSFQPEVLSPDLPLVDSHSLHFQWNFFRSTDPRDYLSAYQRAVLRAAPEHDPFPLETENPYREGFDWTESYGEFLRFRWWDTSPTWVKAVGVIAIVSGATAAIGATILAGKAVAATGFVGGVLGISLAFHLGGLALVHQRSDEHRIAPLLDQASEHLQHWNPDQSSTFDWGSFFVDLDLRRSPEFDEAQRRRVENRWQTLVDSFMRQDQSDPMERVEAIYDLVYLNTHIRNPVFPLHRMIDFLRDDARPRPEGNCHNRAQLVIAAMLYARLPPPYVVGIQTFSTHVEPVIYNRQTGEVYDIISGAEPTTHVRASIYHPEIWLHAFLQNHGRSSPWREEDFMIVRGEDSPAGLSLKMILGAPFEMYWRFTGAEGDGMNRGHLGDPEWRSDIPNPFDVPLLPPPAHRFRMDSETPNLGAGASQIHDPHSAQRNLFFAGPFDIFVEEELNDTRVVFRTHAQEDYFNRLQGQPDEQRQFIRSLTEAGIRRYFDRPEMQEFVSIFRGPPDRVLPRLAEIDPLRLPLILGELKERMNYLDQVSSQVLHESGDNPFYSQPQISALIGGMRNFGGWIQSHPREGLGQIDQVSFDRQTGLLGFISSHPLGDGTRAALYNIIPEAAMLGLEEQMTQASLDLNRTSVSPPNSLQEIVLVSPDFETQHTDQNSPARIPESPPTVEPLQVRSETIRQFLNVWLTDELMRHLVNVVNQALRNPSHDHNLYMAQARILELLGHPEGILTYIDRAIQINPRVGHNYRGTTLNGFRRFDEALVSFDRAIQTDPNIWQPHAGRAMSLTHMDRCLEALSSIDRAISINPYVAQSHDLRGLILNRLDRLEEALEAFNQAIHIDPNYSEAYIDRGTILERQGRLPEALASYDRARNYPSAEEGRERVLQRMRSR